MQTEITPAPKPAEILQNGVARLNDLIANGAEFPDAAYSVASEFNLNLGELEALYDFQFSAVFLASSLMEKSSSRDRSSQ